jgi:death-on-curing family protein
VSLTEAIREAIDEHIAQRVADEEFQRRLKASMDRHRRILDRLAKAGVLGYRLARHHCLPDGNKRTALLALVDFVERNGHAWNVPDEDEAVEMMLAAAAGTISERDFITWAGRQIR